jgi:hypothetical protein
MSCEAGLFRRAAHDIRMGQSREANRQFSNHWFFCVVPAFCGFSEGAI